MTRKAVHELLQQLHESILQEREHAKELDIQAMSEDMQQKEALLQILGKVEELHPDDRILARQIQQDSGPERGKQGQGQLHQHRVAPAGSRLHKRRLSQGTGFSGAPD